MTGTTNHIILGCCIARDMDTLKVHRLDEGSYDFAMYRRDQLIESVILTKDDAHRVAAFILGEIDGE